MKSYEYEINKLVTFKVNTNEDLLDSIKKCIFKHKIKNGIILNGIGSSKTYSYHVVSDSNLPPAEDYIKKSRAVDIVGMQGYVLDGRLHAHITFSDDNIAFGGHLEEGVKVLTFVIMTIAIIDESLDISNWDSVPI